jgi:hypothetical protein
MGGIPGPLQNVAVVYPFLKEVPLGRLTELLAWIFHKPSRCPF